MEYQARATNLPDDDFVRGYLECAEWSGIIDDEQRDEFELSIDPLWSDESLETARKDCADFIKLASKLLNGCDLRSAGHDFWLTRNRHGAGFWGGDYENGDELTKLSHPYGESYVWFEDGVLHLS